MEKNYSEDSNSTKPQRVKDSAYLDIVINNYIERNKRILNPSYSLRSPVGFYC